jgi:hypothetical protein
MGVQQNPVFNIGYKEIIQKLYFLLAKNINNLPQKS